MTSLTLTGKERSVPSRPLPNPPPRLLLVGGRHRRPYCWSLARPPKDGTRRVHRDMVRGPMLLKSLWAAVQPPHLADAAASTATDAPTMATASPPARRKRRGIRARQGNRYPPPKPPRIAVTAAPPSALITATPHVATCRNLSHRPAADTDFGTWQRDEPAPATATAATTNDGAPPLCAAVIAIVAGRSGAPANGSPANETRPSVPPGSDRVPTIAGAGQSRLRY